MNASNEARALLDGVLKLETLSDLEFVLSKAQVFLELKREASAGPDLSSEELQDYRKKANRVLVEEDVKLSGPQAALIAGWLLLVESDLASFATGDVKNRLETYGRSSSNVSRDLETSVKSKDLSVDGEDGRSNGRRDYSFTKGGVETILGLLREKFSLLSAKDS